MAESPPVSTAHPLRRPGEDPLAFLEALAATGEDLVPCRIGRRPAVLVNEPALIEELLVRRPDDFVKGRGYARAARLVGGGLLTASGAQHAAQRRLLQPAFHRSRLAGFAQAIVDEAIRRRSGWSPGAPIAIDTEMQELALAVAGAVLFGADLQACAARVRAAVAEALSPLDGLLAVVAPPAHARRARRVLEAIVDDVIARRGETPGARGDLLDLLLASSSDEGPGHVRDEAITFLLAGHDTVAHALTWTWVLLADHPEVEARLHEEIARVLEGRVPGVDDLRALPYTRGVFAEALRLRPPAWVIVREAADACVLGGTALAPGTLAMVSPWVMHRDARFHRDPSVFDPSRWMSPAAPSPKLSYLPFGAGSRSCIGEHFAWMEGTLVLATMAQRWRFRLVDRDAVRPVPRITLRPAGPVMMRAAFPDTVELRGSLRPHTDRQPSASSAGGFGSSGTRS